MRAAVEKEEKNAALRKLPSVGKLLGSKPGTELSSAYGHGLTAYALRSVLGASREALLAGGEQHTKEPELLRLAEAELRSLKDASARRVINATGIILHTGLGRAPLSRAAVDAVSQCGGYTQLEVDPISGGRSKREARAENLLRELTGAEAATVVNNCASAIFLALSAIASPGEVVISRGQLVEIGGSYRMPDVMTASGCTLREVGTTNRTSIDDYRRAINERTSAILIVSQSNFRIRGFTHSPAVEEICALANETATPVLYDLGGGALVGLERWGFSHETMVQEAVAAGVSLVCFSGDKLIGGPQAGILCGRRDAVASARRNPFFRMVRPDKLCLAALEASLVPFLNGTFEAEIPLFRMACVPAAELETRGRRILERCGNADGFLVSLEEDLSYLGGGSLPDEALASWALRLELDTGDERRRNRWANTAAKSLRLHRPSVFCRIENGGLMFNLRTVFEPELDSLAEAALMVLQS